MIRYNDANAIDARRHGMSAADVAEETVTQRRSRLMQLRKRAKGESEALEPDTWWSRSSGAALARDYEDLTREILTRISAKEAARANLSA